MEKHKIEVSYSRVFEIEAEDSYDAREKAKHRAVEDLEGSTSRAFVYGGCYQGRN